MRSILLHVDDDDCMQARLQIALDLARQFDAHLTCLQAVAYEFGVAGDLYGTMAAQMAAIFRENADQVQETLERGLSVEDVRWEWLRSEGRATDQIARHAPLNDLVIVGAHNPAGRVDFPSILASDLAMEVRAPILVAPAGAAGFQLDRPAMVAWNGSAESARALRSAMPMLARASAVHLLWVEETKEKGRNDLPPTDAAIYLARHGIEAIIDELHTDKGLSVADILLSASDARNAAYLVMGAYGHSRLRERILGGVTRDMLTDPKLPLLLTH